LRQNAIFETASEEREGKVYDTITATWRTAKTHELILETLIDKILNDISKILQLYSWMLYPHTDLVGDAGTKWLGSYLFDITPMMGSDIKGMQITAAGEFEMLDPDPSWTEDWQTYATMPPFYSTWTLLVKRCELFNTFISDQIGYGALSDPDNAVTIMQNRWLALGLNGLFGPTINVGFVPEQMMQHISSMFSLVKYTGFTPQTEEQMALLGSQYSNVAYTSNSRPITNSYDIVPYVAEFQTVQPASNPHLAIMDEGRWINTQRIFPSGFQICVSAISLWQDMQRIPYGKTGSFAESNRGQAILKRISDLLIFEIESGQGVAYSRDFGSNTYAKQLWYDTFNNVVDVVTSATLEETSSLIMAGPLTRAQAMKVLAGLHYVYVFHMKAIIQIKRDQQAADSSFTPGANGENLFSMQMYDHLYGGYFEIPFESFIAMKDTYLATSPDLSLLPVTSAPQMDIFGRPMWPIYTEEESVSFRDETVTRTVNHVQYGMVDIAHAESMTRLRHDAPATDANGDPYVPISTDYVGLWDWWKSQYDGWI
jgi:hypothetical protein